MPIQFDCPHCQKTLKAPSANAGARARCKGCSKVVTIPNADQVNSERPRPVSDQPSKAKSRQTSTPQTSVNRTSKSSGTAKPVGNSPVKSKRSNTPSVESGAFEPDFGSITADLPSFVAGQQHDDHNAAPQTPIQSEADPFSDLPEFQGINAPVEKAASADAEFHRMMLAGSGDTNFVPEVTADIVGAQPTESEPLGPAPDHTDIADVLGGLDTTIQSAVMQQQAKNEAAVRAKFTIKQIRQAFAKPLGNENQLSGLRQKQLQSAITVALVPLGFIAFVVGSSFGVFYVYRAWMHGHSQGLPHPVINLAFLIFVIFLLACWVPTLNLIFASWYLLFGRHDDKSTTQLTRESQPVMYEFVDQICEKLGSPKPCRIDLNCEFNATASLSRGWLGSGKNDLVLTIGIPFIAVQDTEQLASVIAHEFGHFRQGSAMKTYYVIGSLTNWFMMTAYSGLGYFYWFGYLTHLLSGSLSREMEWDADRHAIHLAGTKAFEESSAQLERYGVAYSVTIDNLVMLFQSGILVDNIPRFMGHIGRTMPASVIRRIAEETEKRRLDRFDSHPPTRDRVKAARELAQPGILSLKRPAIDLVDHWTTLCKKITLDFYAENLGFAREEINESHVTPLEDLLRDEHKLLLDRSEKDA